MNSLRVSHLLLSVVSVVALVACGPSAAPKVASFTASPATLPLGGGRTTLSWEVDEASTVSIAPNLGEVSGSSAEVDLTATTKFTLTAKNDKGETTSELTVTVADAATVQGRVITRGGRVAPGVPVVVGEGPPVLTGADGTFTVANVTPPYDAIVLDPGNDWVLVYQGLTTMTPTLYSSTSNEDEPRPWRSSAVTGTMSGLDPFVGNVALSIGGRVNEYFGTENYSNTTDNTYGADVSWAGAETASASFFALQWTKDDAGLPVSYNKFAQVDVPVTEGSTATADLAFNAVGSTQAKGAIRAPAHFGTPSVTMTVSSGSANVHVVDHYDFGESYELPIPTVGKTALSAHASWDECCSYAQAMRRIVSPSGTADLIIPEPPHVLTPPDDAEGVDGRTEFTWTRYGDGTHMVLFQPDGYGPTIGVLTDATSIKLPDFPRLGVRLPAGSWYLFMVQGVGPSATVNDVASRFIALDDQMSELHSAFEPERSFRVAGTSNRPTLTAQKAGVKRQSPLSVLKNLK